MSKPLTLYTGTTPNGHQVSVLLEELKGFYPAVDYDIFKIDISTNVQKEPWFIKMNPNGKIPVLVDHLCGDFVVFESAAILLYLVQKYDKDYIFWFDPANEPGYYSQMLQWIFFTHGGVGPIEGQAYHFNAVAPEDVPYAKKRFREETKRLYGVLQIRLKDRDWLVGPGMGKFSLADIKAFPWVRLHQRAGVDELDEWPAVKAWLQRSLARTHSQLGLKVAA